MSAGLSQGGERDDRRGAGEGPGRLQLPPVAPQEVFEYRLYRIQLRLERLPSGPRIVSLRVHAKHPQFPGAERTFILDAVLRPAHERSPQTLLQTADPSLGEEARREAVGLIVSDLVKNRRLAQEVQRPVAGALRPQPQGVVRDEIEPSFSVQAEHATSFSDFVNGQCRKEVSVLRNEQVVARFVVVQGADALVSAEIVAEPVGLRWALVDRQGDPVTLGTVDDAILDFTQVLRGKRWGSWGVALHAVAQELERRQRIRLDNKGEFYAEPYLYQLMAVAPDEQLWGEDGGRSPVSKHLAPNGQKLRARELSDGRIVWFGLERGSQAQGLPGIVLAGYSSCGSEYLLRLTVPRAFEGRLRPVQRDIANSPTWPALLRAVDRALAVPGSKVVCEGGAQPEGFPQVLNEIIAKHEKQQPGATVARGAPFGARAHFACGERLRVEGVLRGRSPFSVQYPGESPGRSWLVECLLDESLEGCIAATNGLGERVVLELDGSAERLPLRRARVERVLAGAAGEPGDLKALMLNEAESFCHVQDIKPAEMAARIDAVAQAWQRELLRAGHLKARNCSHEIPWWVEPISGGRFILSILPAREPGFTWKMNHSLVVSPSGVEAAFVSCGERWPLGVLRGVSVAAPGENSAISPGDLSVILRALAAGDVPRSQSALEESLASDLPHLTFQRGLGMRQFDLQRNQRDLVQIVRNWLARVFGI